LDQKVLTVAGFVSTKRKWERFNREWQKHPKVRGRRVFSHDRLRKQSRRNSPTAGRDKPNGDGLFIERLARCLKNNVNKSFRTTLIIDDYNAANHEWELEEFLGRPYALCCMVFCFTLRQWAKKKHAERSVLYYSEDGDEDKGNFELHHKATYTAFPAIP
jgi:hypothetical protein